MLQVEAVDGVLGRIAGGHHLVLGGQRLRQHHFVGVQMVERERLLAVVRRLHRRQRRRRGRRRRCGARLEALDGRQRTLLVHERRVPLALAGARRFAVDALVVDRIKVVAVWNVRHLVGEYVRVGVFGELAAVLEIGARFAEHAMQFVWMRWKRDRGECQSEMVLKKSVTAEFRSKDEKKNILTKIAHLCHRKCPCCCLHGIGRCCFQSLRR